MCPPDSKIKYSVFYVYLCSCIIILCVIVLCIFYAIVRQISMLFIDNKDSVFCYLHCIQVSCICRVPVTFTLIQMRYLHCREANSLYSYMQDVYVRSITCVIYTRTCVIYTAHKQLGHIS